MNTEKDFSGGNRNASSLVTGAVNVASFMASSFYLPVDVLRAPGWLVFPIQVISGERFLKDYAWMNNLRCVEEKELLETAHLVGVSIRKNVTTREKFIVAKIWYGRSTK